MDGKLNFLLSRRSKVFEGATANSGRLKGVVNLVLRDELRTVEQTLPQEFQFPGPADIGGFQPGTIRKMCPEPGARDAEETKLVHVDLADPELPWRYTPDVSAPLHPWIVLIVGKAEAFKDARGNLVPPDAAVLKAHNLDQSHRWAHVQIGEGKEISRLVSPVNLEALQNYVAAIVPAFKANGDKQWDVNGIATSPFPIFHSWEFSTGAPGDFETLVNLLRVRQTGNVGVVKLRYRQTDIEVQLRGAITTLAADPSLLGLAAEQLTRLRQSLDHLNNPIPELPGDDGLPVREIVGLPQYGRPWVEDPNDIIPPAAPAASPWVRSLNDDPRYRAIAGMGTWLGIEAQEELMKAAVEQAGALHDVGLKIRQLALGVDLSSRLWRRRLPDDPAQRLQVFGPAMGRLLTDSGVTVLSRITGKEPKSGRDYTLAAAQFSSAAMRILRNGTSRTRHLQSPGTIDRRTLLEASSRAPARPERAPAGLPHADRVINPGISGPPVDDRVLNLISDFSGRRMTTGLIGSFVTKLSTLGYAFGDCVKQKLNNLLLNQAVHFTSREILMHVVRGCAHPAANNQDFNVEILINCTLPEPPDRFTPIPIGPLGGVVSDAIDPTGQDAPARGRIQDVIGNFPIGNLAPPELPLGLDFPTWQLVKKYALDWLLPGVSTIPENSIVALQTNPVFIDAFLVGMNSQFLAEARWRNLWIQRRFTPLRMFWGHIDAQTGRRTADIQPLAEWAKPAALAQDLGDKSHQTIDPRDASGNNDLILLFRTDLFRRYPGTQVYLIKPPAGISAAALDDLLKLAPDFTPPAAPNPRKVFGPIFMGNLTPDVVFFAFDIDPGTLEQYWLVLDEPPAELRFRDKEQDQEQLLPYKADLTFDPTSIDQHTRVAISGEYLERMGGGA